jgi:hypothetical protein
VSELVIEIGAGELFDRMTILEIKARHARDDAQRLRDTGELRRARDLCDRGDLPLGEIAPLVSELRAVNERLWSVEDKLRCCEAARDFGPVFVELSRSVYKNNDLRAAIKRRIDERVSPTFVQDKIYSHGARGG